ncbi:MAG: stage III sporulation protein AD [Clostridia bacterium]|nr:stage III sporulation protein AD [Clostridia bacterium]
MDIIKLIGVGLISLVIIIIVKQYKPEFAIYVSLTAGILILGMTFDTITQIVNLIENYSQKVSISNKFIIVLLKITGIAILSEFATSICKDAGESAIASKIEIGSKIMIISASIPIISSLLEVVLKVLP